MTTAPGLTALVLNCTLTPSPDESSTQLLADQVLAALGKHGVTGDSVRLVDLPIAPGALHAAAREPVPGGLLSHGTPATTAALTDRTRYRGGAR